MKIAAIILAAGRSARFAGMNKLLAEIDGVPMIRRALFAADHASVDDIVLVTSPDGAAVSTMAGPGRWRVVVNPAAAGGLSTSLHAGLQSLDPGIDGALIMLADMPRVGLDLISALCHDFVANMGQRIVFPQSHHGEQGNPVLWPRALFDELLAVSGDSGGKPVLARHRELWSPHIVIDAAAFLDVDTQADLDKALQSG